MHHTLSFPLESGVSILVFYVFVIIIIINVIAIIFFVIINNNKTMSTVLHFNL